MVADAGFPVKSLQPVRTLGLHRVPDRVRDPAGDLPPQHGRAVIRIAAPRPAAVEPFRQHHGQPNAARGFGIRRGHSLGAGDDAVPGFGSGRRGAVRLDRFGEGTSQGETPSATPALGWVRWGGVPERLPDRAGTPYLSCMDQHHGNTQPPPAEWVEAIERSRADLAAGRTVPLDAVLARMDARIAEAEARQAAKAKAPAEG